MASWFVQGPVTWRCGPARGITFTHLFLPASMARDGWESVACFLPESGLRTPNCFVKGSASSFESPQGQPLHPTQDFPSNPSLAPTDAGPSLHLLGPHSSDP